MTKKTFYVLDSFALIYRAYFAMSKTPLINSKGLNVSAISGYLNVLYEIIRKYKPDYLACAFDAPHITDRQQNYEFYKANREETPEDIKTSVPYIKEIVKAFNIPILEVDGYEADDLIGTIARQAEQEDIQVFMVTSDKDMSQLVSENIFLYKPPYMGRPFSIHGLKEVKEKWEVDDPLQVIDILGLWGDAIDNIPGVKGVGEKTAKKLIKEFGSIENIYKNIDKITGSLKNKLEENKELAFISKELATIVIDAPIQFDKIGYALREPNKEVLNEIFTNLEFRTLGRRILGDDFTVTKPAIPSDGQMSLFENYTETVSPQAEISIPTEKKEVDYQLLTDIDVLKEVLKSAERKQHFALDTETTGLDAISCDLVGISLSVEAHKAFYIPWEKVNQSLFIEALREIFSNEAILKIGQNIKFDLQVLYRHGFEKIHPIFDTMIAHYLIDPETKHNMDYLSETYLNFTPQSIEELIGKKGVNQKNMSEVEIEQVKDYAAEDADITLQLYQKLKPELESNQVKPLFDEIEIPLIDVLTEMELSGVAIDIPFLEEYSKTLGEEILQVQDEIYEISGTTFNLESPKQLGEVLFDYMKIPYKGKKTKTGQYSTNEATLQKLAAEQPIIDKILNYRELAKLKSTYIDALPNLINPLTGWVHTTFNQAVTSTGRLSSTNPNLQNIPIRTERGKEIRKAFIARGEDRVIMSADYSQIELRVIASISGDEKMIEAFEKGQDIHASTAANVYNVPIEEVNSTMRRNAKMVNFGIIYGISPFGLGQRLGIATNEAKELIDNYFEKYPSIKDYMDNTVAFAKENGYVQTLYGRKRYLRDINSRNFTVRSFAERNAINAPIQGSAADMIKLAMINVAQKMKSAGLKSQMILQVHDELLFDTYKEELVTLQNIVENEMKNALKLKVPINIGIGFGANWLEAH
ncbi:MAG: DNA polymerase I [Chitinophagales bacterium]|nr:DNA polymerase I [Chitinophagales bacterium]